MMRKKMRQNLRGFTLVELSLSLVFIATLSLVIALIITNTISSYRRGIVLKQINTVGMGLVDDMRSAIQDSSTKSLTSECASLLNNESDIASCEENGGQAFVTAVKKASRVEVSADEIIYNIPMIGAFCTGTYSYIWNSGYFFAEKNGDYPKIVGVDKAKFVYGTGNGTTLTNFKLLKVRDNNRAVCVAASMSSGLNTNTFDIRNYSDTLEEAPIDLLASNDVGLAMYDLTAITPADSPASNSLFYTVSFILGTSQSGLNISSTGNFCATPNEYEGQNFDYCAINKFNFAARATGE